MFIQTENLAQALVGKVLWRPGSHNAMSGFRTVEVPFETTERGSLMGRINISGTGDFLWEPTAFNLKDRRMKGLTVFVKPPIPPDWTYLLVTGIAKTGKCVFADFFGQHDALTYSRFRTNYCDRMRRNLNAPFSAKVEIARLCEIPLPKEHKRLVVHWSFTEECWEAETL
jgi:hypothetical protein